MNELMRRMLFLPDQASTFALDVDHLHYFVISVTMIASLAGSKGAWRVSHHSGGASTRVRSREAVLDSDSVTRLPCGWAAVLELGQAQRALLTRINSRSL